MKLTQEELAVLSAWAREEWEPACYQLPAHRLQLANKVSAAQLLILIKVWTEREGKKDLDIVNVAANPQPRWPWSTAEGFAARLAEANQWRTNRETLKGLRFSEDAQLREIAATGGLQFEDFIGEVEVRARGKCL